MNEIDKERNERRGLSHNLAREWVSENLVNRRDTHATVESEWFGEGVAFPQTSGEFEEPTGQPPPDWVKVTVVLPGIATDRAEMLAAALTEAVLGDPQLGGRVGSARLFSTEPTAIEVEDAAVRIVIQFSITDPIGPLGIPSKD